MTAKQALRTLVERLTEAEARLILPVIEGAVDSVSQTDRAIRGSNAIGEAERIREIPTSDPRIPSKRSIWEEIRAIWADVPVEELDRIPSSDDIDEVVYGRPASA